MNVAITHPNNTDRTLIITVSLHANYLTTIPRGHPFKAALQGQIINYLQAAHSA